MAVILNEVHSEVVVVSRWLKRKLRLIEVNGEIELVKVGLWAEWEGERVAMVSGKLVRWQSMVCG
jgi:hypothetical protein